jgi:hypothetical protein
MPCDPENGWNEIIMKGTHTLGGNPRTAVLWVEIAREEIERAVVLRPRRSDRG